MNKSVILLVILAASVAFALNLSRFAKKETRDCRLKPGEEGYHPCRSFNARCFPSSCNQETGECEINASNAAGCAAPESYQSLKNLTRSQKSTKKEQAKSSIEARGHSSNLIRNGGFENYYDYFCLTDWTVLCLGACFVHDTGNHHVDALGNLSPQPAKGNGQAVVAFQDGPFATLMFQDFNVSVDDCVENLEISFRLALHNFDSVNTFNPLDILLLSIAGIETGYYRRGDANLRTNPLDILDGLDPLQVFTVALFYEGSLAQVLYATNFDDGPANFGYKKFKVDLKKVVQAGGFTNTAKFQLVFVVAATGAPFDVAVDDVRVTAECEKK